MKLACLILLMAAFAAMARADVATSADYALTIISLDAGGEQIASSNYTSDVVLGTIAGRSITTFATLNNAGYAAELNNPPTAADDVRSHPQDGGIDIPGTILLANDFDLDGDEIHIGAFDGASEQGGIIFNTRGILRYSPPIGLQGSDRFDYVVLDENGDFNVATVTMVTAPAVETQPLHTLQFYKQSDGTYLLRWRENPGMNEYQIFATTSLDLTDWKIFQIAKAGLDGIVETIVDPRASARLFFKAVAF